VSELVEASVKGTSKYILDLEGGKHATRSKSELAQREKDLAFSLVQGHGQIAMGTDTPVAICPLL
jgi:hypothetical protein